MKLFGTSGIRGLVHDELSVSLASVIGKAAGTLYPEIVIGFDPRTTNEMFLEALKAGILSSGGNVWEAGMVSTPTLACAASNFSCGIIITASHNPPEYNGIKFVNPDGTAFDTTQMMEMEDIIDNSCFRKVGWKDIRHVSTYHDAIRGHIDAIRSHIPPLDIRVVVDCGCGAGSSITPYLLRELGCHVITLNSQPDGFFPARPSEPAPKNLKDLMDTVKSTGAQLGIAQDGDADRMIAVDECGVCVDGDKLLAIFSKEEAKTSIAVPINASMIIDDINPGVEIVRTKVGDVYVSEAIKQKGCDFGGEPSGCWIFPENSLCPDGIFSAARIAELAQEKPLSERVREIPTYPIIKEALSCPNDKKAALLERAEREVEALSPREINRLDGLKAVFDDGWLLIRPSGTEPKVRVTAEARDEKVARNYIHSIISKINVIL